MNGLCRKTTFSVNSSCSNCACPRLLEYGGTSHIHLREDIPQSLLRRSHHLYQCCATTRHSLLTTETIRPFCNSQSHPPPSRSSPRTTAQRKFHAMWMMSFRSTDCG